MYMYTITLYLNNVKMEMGEKDMFSKKAIRLVESKYLNFIILTYACLFYIRDSNPEPIA